MKGSTVCISGYDLFLDFQPSIPGVVHDGFQMVSYPADPGEYR